MGALRMDLRALFGAKSFWISCGILIAIIRFQGEPSNLLYMALPVASAFPYSNALLDEYTTHFGRFALHRTQPSVYLLSKILVCWLSGVTVAAIPALLCRRSPLFLGMYGCCGGCCALLGMAFSLLTQTRAV